MIASQSSGRPGGGFFTLLCLLWLTGASTRFTILAVPPLLPLIHDDLHLVETQVGLLVALPLILFAVASVPGSLLIARIGVVPTAAIGLVVTAAGAASRGMSADVATLYAATIAMGFGVAIVQPALPQLVQRWMPARIAFGSAVYTNGTLVGTTLTAALTLPVVLPAVGASWRAALAVWAAPVALSALTLVLLAPRDRAKPAAAGSRPMAAWWPDWKSPVIWQLGLTFGANNSIFYGLNAFVPDYLAVHGGGDLVGSAVGWLSGSQLIASFALLAVGGRLHRRAWPFLTFGTTALASLTAMMFVNGFAVVVLVACIGFSTSMSYTMLLALPPVLSAPEDVHRTAAGMFTISFSLAVLVPTASGAVWDLTGTPWAAFVPLVACALVLIVLGARLARLSPHRS